MNQVLIFKTSVETPERANELRSRLDALAGKGNWNFALDDCDRILRVVSEKVGQEQVIRLLKESGFDCLELDDSVLGLVH